ncbi:hypothetical protein ACF0H5_017153 [Mactra antiquata]
MRLKACLLFLFTWYCVNVFSCVRYSDTYPWKPDGPGKDREDLACHIGCKYEVEESDCCRCWNCAIWAGTEVDLFVEFVTILGKGVVLSEETYNESSIYKIEHTHSDLTDLPSNICNWDSEPFIRDLYEDEFDNMQAFWPAVVELDFQYNRIRRLQDINCLTKLDAVNLQGNKLTYVSNHSFHNLIYLRTINFTNNQIQYIDPSTIGTPTLNLINVDFSHNIMTELDIMNVLSHFGYCVLDFSHNDISHLTNKPQQSLNVSKKYGPGFTSFRNNEIVEFPNFKVLFHLEKMSQLGKLIEFGFDFRENPLNCDCAFQPILSQAEHIFLVIMRNYMDIICQSPPDLEGISIRNVDLDRLLCQLPASAGCKKPECLCIDKPNDGRIYVDCSNSDLGEVPDVPYSEYSSHIYLNISDNRINTIRNVSYLSTIDVIDLSKNDIVEIPSEVANLLENASVIDISDNLRLKSLPREFQRRDICKTFMRNLVIRCDCNSTWIQTWVHSKPCNSSYVFFMCDVPDHGLMPALSFNADELNCFSTNYFLLATWIVGVLIVLMLLSVTAYYLRYEILILYLRIRKLKFNKVVPQYNYDVFISYNDNDDSVRMWVEKTLLYCLQREKYSIFLPNRDLVIGGDRNMEVNAAILNSRNALVVLSDSYTEQREDGMRPWTENEWKFSWNNFKTYVCKNIVLVNFDHASPSDIEYPPIRAYLRVGCTVCFKNNKRCIIQEIRTKLGPPFRLPELPDIGLHNKNTKPSLIELFVVPTIDNDIVRYQDEESDEELCKTDYITSRYRRNNNSNKRHAIKPVLTQPKCQYRQCYACQRSIEDHKQ